jgi:hypothetical protein
MTTDISNRIFFSRQMHSYRFCVCAVSIHLDTSVQVTNIGMNPPYVDLYYATTVFFHRATVRKRFHKPEMVTLKALHPQAKCFGFKKKMRARCRSLWECADVFNTSSIMLPKSRHQFESRTKVSLRDRSIFVPYTTKNNH